MAFDVSLLWALVIYIGVFVYVTLDGFDLGVGILFKSVTPGQHRDALMNSIAPVWDGNETWMVLGGAALLAAYPIVYSTVLTALYLPLMFMLFAFIFRGVAFEFRFKTTGAAQRKWDESFFWGSLSSAFFQGVALGGYLSTIKMDGRVYVGNAFDCFTPFTITVGVATVAAYTLLGAGWLIFRTEGELQKTMITKAKSILIWLLVMIAIVWGWTPFNMPYLAARWFTPLGSLFLLAPIGVLFFAFLLHKSLQESTPNLKPFFCILGIVVVTYLSFVCSVFPLAIPPHIDYWQAAGPASSQWFSIIGVLVLLPVVLVYLGFIYWTFIRSKVKGDEGYH